MKKAKLMGDFLGSSEMKDDHISGTPRSKDLSPELKVFGDMEIKSLVKETTDFIISRLRSFTYQRALNEMNVDINELCVYLMPHPVDMESNYAEACYSFIIENVTLDSYKNTLFVFRNFDRSKLVEVWPGVDFSTSTVFQEAAAPGRFQYEEWTQDAEERIHCLNVMDYWDIRISWILLEVYGIISSIVDDAFSF